MSDVVAVALISALVPATLSVVIFSINKYSDFQSKKEDNREWYKRTFFETRVRAVQEAFARWRTLNDAISLAHGADLSSDERQTVHELIEEFNEWYNTNSLALEGKAARTSEFVGMINTVRTWNYGHDERVPASLNAAYRQIRALADSLMRAETTTGGASSRE